MHRFTLLSSCLLAWGLLGAITTALAQVEIGAGLVFGTEADEIGLGLKGHIPLSPRFDLSPGVNLFVFESEGANQFYYWEVNGDVHALFDATPQWMVYPLLGLNLGVKQWRGGSRADDSAVQLGLNLGGGTAYYFTPSVAAFSELKFVVSQFDQAVLNLGVRVSL